jgi:hypothetical protein
LNALRPLPRQRHTSHDLYGINHLEQGREIREQGRQIREQGREMREGFATLATGMAKITALLTQSGGLEGS